MKTLIKSIVMFLLKPFAVSRLRSRLLPGREGIFFQLGLALDMQAYAKILKSLGENSVIHPSVEIRYPGNVSLGSHSRINHGSELYGAGGIQIGSGTMLAYHVCIFSDMREFKNKGEIRSQPKSARPVVIGDDVWIGAHAIILPGVTIADHAIVGAGSVVTKNIGPWEIAAGNPARLIGSRLDAEGEPEKPEDGR